MYVSIDHMCADPISTGVPFALLVLTFTKQFVFNYSIRKKAKDKTELFVIVSSGQLGNMIKRYSTNV